MPDPPSRFTTFLAELRRRRVFRVAAVYGGVAFILCQIVDATFGSMGIPLWGERLVFALLALGFPVAIALAWAFDITDKGIVRAKGKAQVLATSRRPILTNWTLGIVAVLAIIVAVWALLREPSPGGALISSIAVLPLENLMNDPEQDYFVDGMHDALISELGKIGALRVIGRTSVLGYRDAPKPIPEIAQELKVDAIVEGSVLLVGGEVKITAQLVAASPERHLWTDSYIRSVSNVLSLHSEVARAIAKEIGLALTPEEEAYLASAPQVNPEAYNLYLKGWYFRNLGSEESMPKAVEYLEQAVALDPGLARAWVALGQSYLMMQWTSGWDDDYALDRMKPALDKALELDPNLPEAHAGLGIYQELAQYDIAGAETSLRRALELDLDNVYARHEYGVFLARRGRLDESLAEFRRAHDLDPLNPEPLWGIGVVYLTTRHYDKAVEYLQAVLELAPDNWLAPSNMASAKREILMQQGRYAEVAEQAGVNTRVGRRARMAMGNVEEVYTFRDSLMSTGELQQRERENPFWSARFYAIMGERDKALSLLEKAYEDASRRGLYLYDPEFDSLRAEPRFKALMQKLGLREVFDQYGQRIR